MYNKEIAEQNKKMTERASYLILLGQTLPNVVKILKEEYPTVNEKRIHRIVDKTNRLKSVRAVMKQYSVFNKEEGKWNFYQKK